jgi:hypothetical protein
LNRRNRQAKIVLVFHSFYYSILLNQYPTLGYPTSLLQLHWFEKMQRINALPTCYQATTQSTESSPAA